MLTGVEKNKALKTMNPLSVTHYEIDLDEAGQGNIAVTLKSVEIKNNWNQGLEFDEAGKDDVNST